MAVWLDSLDAGTVDARATAVFALGRVAAGIPPEGRTRLITLLDRELRGQMPVPDTLGADGDPELYREYVASLTHLVVSFNDPRATPLLAREAISYIPAAVSQVASAGDAGVGPLIATWNEIPSMRPAVLTTMGRMWHHADSTGHPLAAVTRAAIVAHMLLASADPSPSLRSAFSPAARYAGDPLYLPVLRRLAARDRGTLAGGRSIAAAAGSLALELEQRAAQLPPAALVRSATNGVARACAARWIDDLGTCTSVRATLDTAAAALVRGHVPAAREGLRAARRELDAQRGKQVREWGYELLAGYLDIILGRL